MPRTPLIYSILQIDPLNENRCCGLRKDGMPCNNIVAIASRQSAASILRECTDLPSTSQELKDNFKSAACLLLCKRWHRDQYLKVYRRWRQAWEAYEAEELVPSPEYENETIENLRTNVGSVLSSTNGGSSRVEPEQSAYQRLVLSIIGSDISDHAKISILERANNLGAGNMNNSTTRSRLASPLTAGRFETASSTTTRTPQPGSTVRSLERTTRPSSDINPSLGHRQLPAPITSSYTTTGSARSLTYTRSDIHVQPAALTPSPPNPTNIHRGATISTTSSPSRTISNERLATSVTVSNRSNNHERSAPPTTPSSNGANTHRAPTIPTTPLLASSPPPSPTRPRSSSTSSNPDAAPIRHSHTECGICMEPYQQVDCIWECHQCRNRTHDECYVEWRAANSGRPRCVYCRADVLVES